MQKIYSIQNFPLRYIPQTINVQVDPHSPIPHEGSTFMALFSEIMSRALSDLRESQSNLSNLPNLLRDESQDGFMGTIQNSSETYETYETYDETYEVSSDSDDPFLTENLEIANRQLPRTLTINQS